MTEENDAKGDENINALYIGLGIASVALKTINQRLKAGIFPLIVLIAATAAVITNILLVLSLLLYTLLTAHWSGEIALTAILAFDAIVFLLLCLLGPKAL